MKNITNKELQRMKSLMGIKKPINESNILSSTELIKEAPNGKFYGIVRENKKYFIKESNDGVNFDFIGGLTNKTKNQFESYEQAVRRLNLMLEDTNVLTPDIISEKKFVIKTKKKKKKAETEDEGGFGDDETASTDEGDDFDFGDETGEDEDTSTEKSDEESTDEEGGDDFDFGDEEDTDTEEEGGDDFDFGDEEGGEEGGEEESTEEESDEDLDLEDDPIKSIQKMTGKLGQKIRDTEDLSSDTMKWVAKSVISALDLDQMDAEDKKDIIRAIKKKESEGSDEEFDFMADWSSMSANERGSLVNRKEDDMYGPGDNVEKGEEVILDSDDEDYCSYCSDNRSMPYDEEGDEYPGMGSDWRRPMSYMDDPYMMPQPAPARPQTRPETPVKPAKPGTDKPSPSKRPFTPPPHITPGEEPNPKAGHECTHCNGYGYDDMTGEECEWCMGTGYEEVTHQYNKPTDRYYDNVQDYGTSQVMDYMEEPEYFGDMNKDKSPTDEWRKHQLPYDTKFDTDFMEDDDMEMCNACEGKGREMHRIGFSRRESTCPICDGAGYVPRTEAGGEVDEPYVDDSNSMGYKSSSTLPSKVGYNVQYREKFNFPFNMGENKKRRKSLTEDHINDKMATYDQEMAYEDIEAMARQNGMEVEFCHKDRSKDVEEQTVYLDLMKNGKAVAKIRINSVGQIEMGHMTGKVFKGEPVDSYPDFDEVLREKRIKMSPAPAPTRREREAPTREKEKEKERERKTPPSRKPFTPPPHITPGEEPNPKARNRR